MEEVKSIVDTNNLKENSMSFLLEKYVSDYEYRRETDQFIEKLLFKNIKSKNYNMNYFIDFANKYIKPLAKNKPYLFETDVITLCLEYYINYLESNWACANDEMEKHRYLFEKVKIMQMLEIYKLEFSNNLEINIKREIELSNYYESKMKTADNLSFEETEELISLYISGGIRHKNGEFLNYILRNLINNKYAINNVLYEHIFVAKIEELLKKDNIEGIKISFKYFKDRSQAGIKSYVDYSGENMVFNKELIKPQNIIDNFIAFFHEKRHYNQEFSGEVSIASLSFAKDKTLKSFLGMGYYFLNYNDISYEKDALYISLKDMYYFIIDVASERLGDMKLKIAEVINEYKKNSAKDTTERVVKVSAIDEKKIENFNLYFESIIKKNKSKFVKGIAKGEIPLVLLHEYDIRGNKKSLFELLEEKDAINKNDSQQIELYDYLIYNEEVSLEYILSNIILLNKNKDSKYYDEVKKIIKEELINRYVTSTRTKRNSNDRNDFEGINIFYDKLLTSIKEKNMSEFLQNKNVRVYETKEEELKECYKELYCILGEMSEQETKGKSI